MEILNSFAKKHNIIVGACHSAPLDTARLLASPFVPFVSGDISKRTDPQVSLRDVRSIIVIGVGYGNPTHETITNADNDGNSEVSPLAQLSSLGVNEDYHIRVKGLLRELVNELKAQGDFKHRILVDSPALDERALAYRAGLGFFGRNGLIISREFGSRFNIGCLLTDIFSISSTQPVLVDDNLSCPPNCSLCINACPANAIGGDVLEASQCISYLTQKEELSPAEEIFIGQQRQLYGCDICQDVCPFNAHMPKYSTLINPQKWLSMSDEDFCREYKHTAMLWRGADILRRNARAICDIGCNLCRDKS
ncbi:MAG: DUF1730 domain-containing protein [Defluviitaleaceae bacterium]|nr:DUF1730 domain-containing protein [Defluviitaleaceae bacterium]